MSEPKPETLADQFEQFDKMKFLELLESHLEML